MQVRLLFGNEQLVNLAPFLKELSVTYVIHYAMNALKCLEVLLTFHNWENTVLVKALTLKSNIMCSFLGVHPTVPLRGNCYDRFSNVSGN